MQKQPAASIHPGHRLGDHDLNRTALLKLNGTMTLVGARRRSPAPVAASTFIMGGGAWRERHRRHPRDQEMLDFCAEHGITSDIETIPIQRSTEAYERLLKGDVKYRFVIDMASLKAA